VPGILTQQFKIYLKQKINTKEVGLLLQLTDPAVQKPLELVCKSNLEEFGEAG
jgi:hypothetical protein